MEIENLLSKMSESLQAGRSFGPPIEQGDVTIVPVAFFIGGGGGGGADPTGDASTVTGSGGGFGSLSLPIGAYVIKDGNVRWVPALDVTRLAVAGIGLVRAVVRLRRRQAR